MARYGRLLTDVQWEKIRPLLPRNRSGPLGGGFGPTTAARWKAFLWMLRSGARRQDMPEEFPSPSTCWRRLRDWEEQEVWLKIWRAFLAELNERQQLKWSESFLAGSFAAAKKGAWELCPSACSPVCSLRGDEVRILEASGGLNTIWQLRRAPSGTLCGIRGIVMAIPK